MPDSWVFFTELRAGPGGHRQTVWRWRHASTSDVTESGPFTVLPDCVADARKRGYDADTASLTLPK